MVSANSYFKAFIKSMKKRIQLTQSLAAKKRKYDDQIISTPSKAIEYKAAVLEIVGKTNIFSKGDSDTLSRIVWKLNKSAEFFKKNQRKIKHIKGISKKAQSVLDELVVLSIRDYLPAIEKLKEIIEKEGRALAKNDFTTYIEEVKKERDLAQEFKGREKAKKILKEMQDHLSNVEMGGLFAGMVFTSLTVIGIMAAMTPLRANPLDMSYYLIMTGFISGLSAGFLGSDIVREEKKLIGLLKDLNKL